ncbi:zf-HC2 domain-containing protein [Amycolatopsis sp. OK19-0408]|uniref:Zf-HC2 domain-containing protein n=1 Tax=Amycolatopsis iheyensis TaxID=2945988 RepID=A0A9X2NEK8_9PSEU|nr:zf-HC2 domain-containing protein [Amycolatopsis iheyensis]MCR6487244.1 zf-HC2 domain-containing protein [Amycolatopsis iheyensis]
MNHASDRLIADYAAGADLPGDQLWGVEAHLETCAVCRARLAAVAPAQPLVEAVWSRLDLDAGPAPVRRRRRRLDTWVTPAMVPWLVMTALVTLLAVLLDRVWPIVLDATVVQLFAPVLPVLGVAASWARGLDPAYEVVTATPRAGLYLVTRRTVAVLAVVLPVLAVAGLLTGTAPALWLLPSLAFTTGTLALGGLVGISRAAYALLAVWVVVILLPAFAAQGQTFALSTGSLPVWAGIFALTSVVVVLRRTAFTRLGAHH